MPVAVSSLYSNSTCFLKHDSEFSVYLQVDFLAILFLVDGL